MLRVYRKGGPDQPTAFAQSIKELLYPSIYSILPSDDVSMPLSDCHMKYIFEKRFEQLKPVFGGK